MGAQWTIDTLLIRVKCELIPLYIAVLAFDSGYWAIGDWHQRRAIAFPADHRFGQRFHDGRIGARLHFEELPEPMHVLSQVAQDQVCAVAAQVTLARLVRCRE